RLKDGADLSNALEKITPRLLDGYGNIELTLSNSRLVEAAEGIDFLLTYPYGCVEQTTSSLIPWLSTQQLRPVMPKLEKSAEETNPIIQQGVLRPLSMQTDVGGLGYRRGAGESILSGSAYGSVAITMAERQGIEVPEVQALALRDYLSLALRNTAELKSPYEI